MDPFDRMVVVGGSGAELFPDTGKSVTVVINDRKPFKPGTVIDLAHGSAVALDIDDDGTGPVQIEVLEQPEANPEPTR